MNEKPARTFEMSLDLDASPEAVWKALTDPDDLERWFPTNATVDPRPGGRFVISWDGNWIWDNTITHFEPGKRLRLVDRSARPFDANGQPVDSEAPVELVLDFTIEARGGRTTLRLVHSGFGHGAAWDDEIDGVSLGWNVELRCLRHYLDHHRGEERFMGWAKVVSDRPIGELWERLVSPAGLVGEGNTAWLHGGDHASLRLTTGDRVEGEVVFAHPGRQIVVADRNLDGALVRLSVDRAAGEAMVSVWVSHWGKDSSRAKALTSRAQEALDRAFARSAAKELSSSGKR